MPPSPVGSRRSLIVSLVLVLVIAFGSLGTTLALGWGPKLGLDLAGGLSVVYKPATHATTADMKEVVTILTNRVDGLGVSGAFVSARPCVELRYCAVPPLSPVRYRVVPSAGKG